MCVCIQLYPGKLCPLSPIQTRLCLLTLINSGNHHICIQILPHQHHHHYHHQDHHISSFITSTVGYLFPQYFGNVCMLCVTTHHAGLTQYLWPTGNSIKLLKKNSWHILKNHWDLNPETSLLFTLYFCSLPIPLLLQSIIIYFTLLSSIPYPATLLSPHSIPFHTSYSLAQPSFVIYPIPLCRVRLFCFPISTRVVWRASRNQNIASGQEKRKRQGEWARKRSSERQRVREMGSLGKTVTP